MRSRRNVIRKVRPHLERLEDRTVPAVFTVNSTLDLPDANPGDGQALAYDPSTDQWVTTLRAAIMEANALPGHDTIYLPAGTYVLTIKGPDEDGGATGDLDILDHVDLIGDGADTTFIQVIAGKAFGYDRVLDVQLSRPGQTLLSGFTVSGGHLASESSSHDGGGMRVLVLDPDAGVTLDELYVTNNTSPGKGGGLFIRAVTKDFLYYTTSEHDQPIPNVGGVVRILNSTIANNNAPVGAGIAVDLGRVFINNSTISQNVAEMVSPDSGLGGGIFNKEGDILLVHVTVAFNRAATGGGLYSSPTAKEGGQYGLANTIVAANSLVSPQLPWAYVNEGPDLYGFLFTSHGCNLIGDNSGSAGFVHGVNFDIVGSGKSGVINPRLGPLTYNGGPTPTHLPLAGSPAINNAFGKLYEFRDQRGFDRPFGPAADIGAVELQEIPISETDLVVDITTPNALVRPGKKLTYTIVVSNAGPGVATDVQLALLLPQNANYLGFSTTIGSLVSHVGRNMIFDLGTLDVGEQATITITVRTRRVGLAVLEAQGTTSSDDVNLFNNQDVAYHFIGRPLYIDDRLLTLLLGRPNGNSWGNGNGNGHGDGGWSF